MNVHVLQHAPFEGLGTIEAWLRAHGARASRTQLFAGEPLPLLDDLDLVIAMGGPMSVNDEVEHPWLVAEKQLIRDAMGRGTAVLGVCLGAQLIAAALGARVYRNADKEIGWLPIRGVARDADVFRFPAETTVFHWHGETFDLPPGAVRLASSDACVNQAFQVGRQVLALQFHLEMTRGAVDAMVEHCGHELVPARYVHSATALRDTPSSNYRTSNVLMDQVLEFLVGARAARVSRT